MTGERLPVVIPWQRLLVHILFLAFTIYVVGLICFRIFAGSWVMDLGSGRHRAMVIPIILGAWLFHKIFGRIYPLAERPSNDR